MYSKVVTQLDIAPTIAKIYNLDYHCEGKVINEVVNKYKGYKVILLIIDALGFSQLLNNLKYFTSIDLLIRKGLFYKCLIYARYTTPAIATILCGRKPEIHRIYKTGDVYKTYITSIPEYLYDHGFKTTVIMEAEGALTFTNKVYKVIPVSNRDNIIEFDDEIINALLKIYVENIDLIVAHIRTLDKYGYNRNIILNLDEKLNMVFNQYADRLLIICGDHPPHNSKDKYVPLIFSSLI